MCPCKANPAPNPAPRTINLPPAQQSRSNHPSIVYQATHPIPTTLSKQATGYQNLLTSSPNIPFLHSSTTLSSHAEVNPARLPSSDTLLSNGQQTTSNTLPESSFNSTQTPLNPRIHELHQQTSLSDSSPPNSSAISQNINTNAGVPGESSAELPSALLASIRQSTRLYDLPRSQLEQLVSEVVREEGFAELAS